MAAPLSVAPSGSPGTGTQQKECDNPEAGPAMHCGDQLTQFQAHVWRGRRADLKHLQNSGKIAEGPRQGKSGVRRGSPEEETCDLV